MAHQPNTQQTITYHSELPQAVMAAFQTSDQDLSPQAAKKLATSWRTG